MTIVDGKITKATESELKKYFYDRKYDKLFSFPDFKERLIKLGCDIEKEKEDEREEKKINKRVL